MVKKNHDSSANTLSSSSPTFTDHDKKRIRSRINVRDAVETSAGSTNYYLRSRSESIQLIHKPKSRIKQKRKLLSSQNNLDVEEGIDDAVDTGEKFSPRNVIPLLIDGEYITVQRKRVEIPT